MSQTQARRTFLQRTVLTAAGLAALPGVVLPSPVATKTRTAPVNSPEDVAAFFKACAAGNLAEVQRLLAAEPQLLAAKDNAGRSGFAVALINQHADVAAHLKAAGYACDLHEAALAQDWERFTELTSAQTEATLHQVNSDHPLGGTAMYAAALGGAGADTWRVFGACGDPNVQPRGAQGVSPLQMALRHPELGVAELTAASLLANGADANPGPNGDAPPLHLAAQRGSVDLVEMLIRLGADVNARDAKNRTALEIAQARTARLSTAEQRAGDKTPSSFAAVVQLLTNSGQTPRTFRRHKNLIDAQGNAYHAPDIGDLSIFTRNQVVGVSHRALDAVQKLVTAEPRLAHSVATTTEICVEACAHTGNRPIVEFLLQHGSPYSLPTAVMRGDFAAVRTMLAAAPERINERGAHDFALLWYPLIGDCELSLLEFLVSQGGEQRNIIEEQHHLGTTALHWACRQGLVETAEFLLDHGANVNRLGRKFKPAGETPLDTALAFGEAKLAEFLRGRGAKTSAELAQA